MWGPSIEGSQWVLSHLEGPNAWVFHWVLALPHIPSLPPGRMLAWVWVSLGAAGRGLAWVWVSALGLIGVSRQDAGVGSALLWV